MNKSASKVDATYRIRNIMKTITGKRKLKKEVIDAMGLACSLFVMDVTYKTMEAALKKSKKVMNRGDIIDTIASEEMFDFCIDIVHENMKGK